MNRRRKPVFPLVILFVVLNAFFIAGRPMLTRYHFSQDLLLLGNLFLFLISIGSFMIAQRGMADKNPNVFVRGVYGSIMMKLFLCMIAAFAYIATQRKDLNKPAFFTLMGLYLVYTFVEVSVLTRQLRNRPAA